MKNLLQQLINLPAGIERDFVLFKWKHANWPPSKLFSAAHGGNCAGNFINALCYLLEWEDTTKINGKTVVLEYERNFNEFVDWARQQLKEQNDGGI